MQIILIIFFIGLNHKKRRSLLTAPVVSETYQIKYFCALLFRSSRSAVIVGSL